MTTLVGINSSARMAQNISLDALSRLRELGPLIICDLADQPAFESLLKNLGTAVERIVIGGGDGTLNRMLALVLNTGLPMGVLPLGTANDFARSLGLPTNLEQAVEVIVEGSTQLVDVASVNDHYFLNALGIGLGPTVTQNLNPAQKKQYGVLAYPLSVMSSVRNRYARHAELVIDGKHSTVRYLQITVANGVHYGGGMTITDDASLHDGQLRVLVLQPQSAAKLASKFFKLRRGVNSRDVPAETLVFTGKEVQIRTRHRSPVSVDGELLTETPLTCLVRPRLISVFTGSQP